MLFRYIGYSTHFSSYISLSWKLLTQASQGSMQSYILGSPFTGIKGVPMASLL